MADRDEFDAILEEPFGQDVDWASIEGMAGPSRLGTAAASAAPHEQIDSASETGEYLSDDDAMDEFFLAEVHRLENQVMANPEPNGDLGALSAVNLREYGRTIAGIPSGVTGSSDFSPRAETSRVSESNSQILGQPPSHFNIIEALPPNWIPPNDQNNNTFLLESPTSTLIEKSLNIRITSLQSSPFECRKSSICCSDGSSPRKKGSCETRQEVSKALEAIEGVLECPICFDTMAASHILSCGHTACGLCLCKWIGKKASCYLCRASHNGPLVPNFSVDEMAAMYFTHRRKIAQGECEAESDWKRWEDRKIKGKEAVHVAEEDRLKGVSPLIPTPMTITL